VCGARAAAPAGETDPPNPIPEDTAAVREREVRRIPREEAPGELLELFYPIHYTVGMVVEDTLRSSKVLNRQQTVILWLIRSQGREGKVMGRKHIERAMTNWFEITSSSISKALRTLAKPPLALVQISEDPESGREKLVKLTPKGERFVAAMVENGKALIKRATDRMTQDEIDTGIHFFRIISQIFTEDLKVSPVP
jgi:DNA-binding MarR family transcriptional regulator